MIASLTKSAFLKKFII